jgi:hypothetical protein
MWLIGQNQILGQLMNTVLTHYLVDVHGMVDIITGYGLISMAQDIG